jgi:hypothetical protein
MIWPAEIPARTDVYQGRLAQYIIALIDRGAKPGTPTDPKRFSAGDLAERKLSYGVAGYALQFMLDTSPSDADAHPLKLSDLIVADVDAEYAPVKMVWGRERNNMVQDLEAGGFDGDVYYSAVWRSDERSKYTGTVLAIDPSGRGNDETAYAIVKFLHGQLFWVASGGFVDGFGETTLKTIAAQASLHGVNVVIIESNYGGGMFDALIGPHLAKYGITNINPEEWDSWSKGQKELRILDTLEPLFKSHRLTVDRKVLEADLKQQRESERYSVVQQMTRMCRVKGALANEDRLEALAMACSFWTQKLNRDQDKLLEKHREELKDEALRKFLNDEPWYPSGLHPTIGQTMYARRRT